MDDSPHEIAIDTSQSIRPRPRRPLRFSIKAIFVLTFIAAGMLAMGEWTFIALVLLLVGSPFIAFGFAAAMAFEGRAKATGVLLFVGVALLGLVASIFTNVTSARCGGGPGYAQAYAGTR